MNDFPKEELEQLKYAVKGTFFNVQQLINKIQHMIDNYCEHEFSMRCHHCETLTCNRCEKLKDL